MIVHFTDDGQSVDFLLDERKAEREALRKGGEAYCIFTNNGKVEYLDNEGKRGLMIAHSHETATRVAKEFLRLGHGKMSVAQIGTIPGETLQGLIACALRDGVDCVYQMGFADDGKLVARVHK